MNTPSVWNFLRCRDTSSPSVLPESDYPVRLLTRRTFGELTGQILKQREYAPQPIPVRPSAARGRRMRP